MTDAPLAERDELLAHVARLEAALQAILDEITNEEREEEPFQDAMLDSLMRIYKIATAALVTTSAPTAASGKTKP